MPDLKELDATEIAQDGEEHALQEAVEGDDFKIMKTEKKRDEEDGDYVPHSSQESGYTSSQYSQYSSSQEASSSQVFSASQSSGGWSEYNPSQGHVASQVSNAESYHDDGNDSDTAMGSDYGGLKRLYDDNYLPDVDTEGTVDLQRIALARAVFNRGSADRTAIFLDMLSALFGWTRSQAESVYDRAKNLPVGRI